MGKLSGLKVKASVQLPLVAVLATLAGCGGIGWHHPAKDPASARADDTFCSRDAEELTLARTRGDRGTYGMMQAGAPIGGRSETPMEMKDRTDTERRYQDLYERCMESKGYTRGDGARR